MTVTAGKIVFCEGKKTSLDYKLLNKVIDGIPNCTIVPSGSKFTFSIFAQGYFQGREPDSRYLVFRDRDFDVQPTPEPQLLCLNGSSGNRSMYLTYRACIENYFLEASLIHDYWRDKYLEKQSYPASKWGHGDSPGIEEISRWIENSARGLRYYQAVRWALGDLLNDRATRKQLKTTWTKGSGNIPNCLDLEACKQKALRLISEFTEAVESVTEAKFEERLDFYQEKFSQEQEEFWSNRDYLIWFHGKDLQKQMQKEQQGYIPLKNFFQWAIDRFDINQHPDLLELREKIEAL